MLYSAQTSSFCLAQLRLLTQKLLTLMSEKAFKVTLAVCSSASQCKATAADGAATLTLHSTSPAAVKQDSWECRGSTAPSQLRLCIFTPHLTDSSTTPWLVFPPGQDKDKKDRLWYWRSFIFSFFFQHFLQQYRRHRIHSFTNTKHTTTTTLVAVAVKKGQRSKLQDVEGYPVTALTIFLLQGVKKQKTKKQKLKTSGPARPPYGYLFWMYFAAI